MRGADCAVYLSEALRRHGIGLAGPHRTVVIPIGIETYPGLSPVWPECFTVCTVTRLIAQIAHDGLPQQLTAGQVGDRTVIAHAHSEAVPLSLRAPAVFRAPACGKRISPVPPSRIELETTPINPIGS